MRDKPFLALCDCAADTLQIHLMVEPDGDFEGYFTFSAWWDQHRPWRDRLKAAWLILRGKSYYFAEVILDREDVDRLHWYLITKLQRQVHIDFTTDSTA